VTNATNVQLARQRVGEGLLSLPKMMMQSADMIIILNARGTVLLNPSFDGLDQQWRIVSLVKLAVDLCQDILLAVEQGDRAVADRPALGTTTHRKAWM
jgi:hypothetical protein